MTAKSPAPAATLTWTGVTARRMARHALTGPAADLDPAGIAGVLCGAHAQVLSAAELSIGRRIAGARPDHGATPAARSRGGSGRRGHAGGGDAERRNRDGRCPRL